MILTRKIFYSLLLSGLCFSNLAVLADDFNCPTTITCNGKTSDTCVSSDPKFHLDTTYGIVPVDGPPQHSFFHSVAATDTHHYFGIGRCYYLSGVSTDSFIFSTVLSNVIADRNVTNNWHPDGTPPAPYVYQCDADATTCPLTLASAKK